MAKDTIVKIDVAKYQDHFSLMNEIQKQVCRKWKITKAEFISMIIDFEVLKKTPPNK